MMATQKPDLYAAYIGHSQIVQTVIDTILYQKVYSMAQKEADTTSLKVMNSIGKPPYEKAKSVGQLMRIIKKYERVHSDPAPDAWFTEAAAYSNPKDNQHREEGDDYSFVYFVGDKAMGIASMCANINLLKDRFTFSIPVYFIQGNEDLLTPKENSRKYFEAIKAPAKKYFLMPRAAHGFNEAVLETLYNICKGISIN
jgi:pimeloyl-ACP methyl ester carboxylesterase